MVVTLVMSMDHLGDILPRALKLLFFRAGARIAANILLCAALCADKIRSNFLNTNYVLVFGRRFES